MLFRKKKEEEPRVCTGCGCLMQRAWKKVEVEGGEGILFGGLTINYGSSWPHTELYCGRCAPPYDIKLSCEGETHFYRIQPSQNIEVDEKGKPIKKKK